MSDKKLDFKAATDLSRDLIDWEQGRKEIARDSPYMAVGFGYASSALYTGGFNHRITVKQEQLQKTLVQAIDDQFIGQCKDLGIIPPEWLTKPPEPPPKIVNTYEEAEHNQGPSYFNRLFR